MVTPLGNVIGPSGADGVGIQSVTSAFDNDGNTVVTVTLTDGTATSFTVLRGADGADSPGGLVGISMNGAALTATNGVIDLGTVITAHQDISGKVNVSAVGAAGGVAELDASGKVPTAQLPSYVDDVLECASAADFPATGESGKIYIAANTNLCYRWTGSAYVEISPSLALGETSSTAYRGDRGKAAYDHAQTVTGNPHGVTKSDVGLGNVDNTSDANKPISTAMQAALNNKVDKDGAKVLSDNNYTTAEKSKLAGIPSDATNNDGTITGITMNGVSKGTGGVVNLGAVSVSGDAWTRYAVGGNIPDFIVSANANDQIFSYASASSSSGRGGTRDIADTVIFANRAGGDGYVGCFAIIGKTQSAVMLGTYNQYGQTKAEHIVTYATPAGNVVYVSRNSGSFNNSTHITKCVVEGVSYTLTRRVNVSDSSLSLSAEFLSIVDAILFGDANPVAGTGTVLPDNAAPLMDGTASLGTSAIFARFDHVHPADTSRASAADLTALEARVAALEAAQGGSS